MYAYVGPQVSSLAVSALIAMPVATAPAIVGSNKVNLVRASLMLLQRLVAERKRVADAEEAEDNDDDDDDDEFDEDEEDGEEDGDVHEKESDMISRLLQACDSVG